MVKGKALDKGGSMYNALHKPQDRLITSAIITCVMLLPVTGLSFFLPTLIVLAILFAPGILALAFGGVMVRRHPMYNLSTNQRLAIERYRSADKETQKMFPHDWENTVRQASDDGYKSDAYQLASAAEKILAASQKRKESLNLRDDKVEVALQILNDNIKSLEVEAQSNEEILAPKPKRMRNRQIVDR